LDLVSTEDGRVRCSFNKPEHAHQVRKRVEWTKFMVQAWK